MDDPKVIAAKIAARASATVDEAAKVAVDAANKINDNDTTNFTPDDAAASLFEMTRIAIRGASDIARIPLQTAPDPKVLLLADHLSTVVRRGLLEATRVAEDSLAAFSAKKDFFDRDEWLTSAIKLTRIGMLRGAEIAQTIAAGPGAYGNPVLTSDPIPVEDIRTWDRTLTAKSLCRKDVPNEDICGLVSFEPADARLLANATTFRLVVNSAGIPSGVYVGEVTMTGTGAGAGTVDTQTVSFEL
ncbi:hypothetical protein [Mycolicibacterium arseniciresistens]|uniref:Uncharacterized protein n=1 Tax=Mycolicibacterium arseniciresistens TaxID=3062257 RepID=A0ABT8UIN0_9MYCO|nr:hypothetical protein [Mycolicibacterium arseniciresistens]MDO3637659.1 hypothetical protein [Mycolicibacterium arseniciresistens]